MIVILILEDAHQLVVLAGDARCVEGRDDLVRRDDAHAEALLV